MSTLRSTLVSGLFWSLSALALVAPANSQGCNFGDDGLANVPCCQPAQLNIPQFPPLALSGAYACFKDCSIENQFNVRVQVSYVQVLCDLMFFPITVTPGSTTAPGYQGILVGKYARTWLEPDPTGASNRQIWRFLVNGDLNPTAGAQPCPRPPHPAGAPTNFHGHIDYACEVNAAGQQVFRLAMSLNHLQGCVEHGLFSCTPYGGAAAHNDRSYHLVAPGNFAFVPVPPMPGPLVAESVRSTQFLPAYRCLGEGRVFQGQTSPANQDCLCVPPTPVSSHPYTHYRMAGTVGCAGAAAPFNTVPIGLPLAPLPAGATELGLGMWTGAPGSFPGARTLSTHWGLMNYPDPCNPNDPPFHFVQGVSTSNQPGFLFSQPGAVFNTFLDLSDMRNQNALVGGPIFPAWGCLYVSKLVWNLNVP